MYIYIYIYIYYAFFICKCHKISTQRNINSLESSMYYVIYVIYN